MTNSSQSAANVSLTARGIVLDIEGTTSSIQFVHDVMFPYARREVAAYLNDHWGDPELEAALDDLARDAGCADRQAWLGAGETPDARQRIAEFVYALMDRDAKVTGLKQLQGLVWRRGFQSGDLQAHLFPDVAAALRRWQACGLQIWIYSSGSVESQRLFFGHTIGGDLLPLLSGHFDTRSGGKKEPSSYQRILQAIGLAGRDVVFVSDIPEELAAAQSAGLQPVLSLRPGNAPVSSVTSFPAIESFDQLCVRLPPA